MTVMSPSAVASAFIWFIMWTKNGKFNPGTDSRIVSDLPAAKAGPQAAKARPTAPASSVLFVIVSMMVLPSGCLFGQSSGCAGSRGRGIVRRLRAQPSPLGRLRKRLTIGKRLGCAALNKVVWPPAPVRRNAALTMPAVSLVICCDHRASPMPRLPTLNLTVILPLALIGVAAATALGVGVVASWIASDALTRESGARLSTAA